MRSLPRTTQYNHSECGQNLHLPHESRVSLFITALPLLHALVSTTSLLCFPFPAMAVSTQRRTTAHPINSDSQAPTAKGSSLSHTFAFSDFLRREYRFGLDPGRPYCKAFREGHCPLGNTCPDKHQITHSFNNLVCKHWLRGLCKKGDQCEFLHEYNLYVYLFPLHSRFVFLPLQIFL